MRRTSMTRPMPLSGAAETTSGPEQPAPTAAAMPSLKGSLAARGNESAATPSALRGRTPLLKSLESILKLFFPLLFSTFYVVFLPLGLAISLAYSSGEEGGNLVVQMIIYLPSLA